LLELLLLRLGYGATLQCAVLQCSLLNTTLCCSRGDSPAFTVQYYRRSRSVPGLLFNMQHRCSSGGSMIHWDNAGHIDEWWDTGAPTVKKTIFFHGLISPNHDVQRMFAPLVFMRPRALSLGFVICHIEPLVRSFSEGKKKKHISPRSPSAPPASTSGRFTLHLNFDRHQNPGKHRLCSAATSASAASALAQTVVEVKLY